ncbi:protein NO VEIN domain-containing protein [Chromohalobacter sarecensis]|uniref:Protein NO VEIN domain-containing protein n=1 Tax=Chromohalobacter sarecensis TaxID=245294 RepID=A0ABV9D149_9GAMM|nr:DUF3883 domain-containing protein [Chromohalobacter sarecensis]MCK0716381.1 DUF3883 domain-containing protein [Chromohalobacter sarecensis]
MTKFVAIKVHYDHRGQLPRHLKYSIPPTAEEYSKYLELFSSGVGGEGFHECMNFAIPESGDVPIYLPPTCIPAASAFDEEFVFFTFTYKGDRELPASIVGVHAQSKMVDRVGLDRSDIMLDFLDVNLLYQAVAKSEYVTLFTEPLGYDYKEGVYTPSFDSWGYGLRYLEDQHAKRLITDAFSAASEALRQQDETTAIVSVRELEVLSRIHHRYFGAPLALPAETENRSTFNPSEPDPEVGNLGERVIYEQELAYAKAHKIPLHKVQWVSQATPSSVYDILSARLKNEKIVPHYIEVKSSRMDLGQNIIVSHRQVVFLEKHRTTSSVALVSFSEGRDSPNSNYYLAGDFLDQFELEPVKYRAVSKK